MKKLAITAIIIFSGWQLAGQHRWTLRECVEHAVENNIDIRQLALQFEQQEVNLNTSRLSRLPELSAGVGQSLSFGRSQSIATGIYESNQASGTSLSVSASVPVFQGFRIKHEIESSRLNLLAAMESLNKARDNMELRIASLYLDALFRKEILAAYGEQLNLSVEQQESTRILVEAGKVPLSQLYDQQSQVASNQMQVTMAEGELADAILELAQALNIIDASGFDIIDIDSEALLEGNTEPVPDPMTVFYTAQHVKPHVAEAEYRLDASIKDIQVARSGLWPTLYLGMSYDNGFNHYFDSNYENLAIGRQLKNNHRENIGLNLNITIFNRMQARNRIKSARITADYTRLDLDNVKLSLYKEIQQAHQGVLNAGARLEASLKAVQAAELSLEFAVEKYNVGKSTVVELKEAQTALLNSRSERIQAIFEYVFRTKILNFYMGKRIDLL